MQRSYGTPMPIELFVGGATPNATLVPGGSVQPLIFQPASLHGQVGGDSWPCARGIVVKAVIGAVDQAASGGTSLQWDELFVVLDSLGTSSQMLGTIHDPSVFTGPVAKHLVEFVANGYRYADWARADIVGTDGDTANVTIYYYLPFTAENFVTPEGFWPWVGWLANLNLTIKLAAASAIAAFSTGAVIKTGVTLTAWIDAYVLPQPIRFLVSQWNKYQSNAAAGNTALQLQSIGQAQGLAGALPGCRIAGIFELCSPNGMGGVSTGDLFTSFGSSDLGQERINTIDAFMLAYRTVTGHGGPSGISDGAGNPNTMAATPNLALMNLAQMYVPWRFCSRNQRIENLKKWLSGTITLNRDFTVAPTSGAHTVITNEIRELDGNKWNELKAVAGLAGADVTMLSDRPLRKGQAAYQAGVFKTRAA